MPVLRPGGKQGHRFAGKQKRGLDPEAAGVPDLSEAVYDLREDRRDPLHDHQKGRIAAALRSPEAAPGDAQSLRKAADRRR